MVTASAIGMVILAGSIAGQSAAPAEKTAGEAMKNVMVLKDVPASEWQPTMVFITGALGVRCQYCHAEPFDSDTKKTKVTARNMMKMTREINAHSFGGLPVVTCNTCHQGSALPKGTPSLWNKTPEQLAAYKKDLELSSERAKAGASGLPAPAVAATAPALPDLDLVFANYRNAVGVTAVKSVHMVGTLAGDLTPAGTLDGYFVFPDKFALAISFAGNQGKLVMNGDRGWALSPQGKFDFPPERMTQVRGTANLFKPLKFESADVSRKVTGIEKTGDRTCFVVESSTAKKLERLYFDTQTGLLYKVHTENRTALGPEPSELIFEDYRDVSGAKMPASIVVISLGDRLVYKFSEIQINVDVDPAKFEPPPAVK